MKRIKRRLVPIAAVLIGSATLLGCSTTTKDFKSEGEKFLESPDLAAEAGYTFADALCEEPSSTVTGTQYSCTATDNDGDQWEFVVEITGERALTFVSGEVIG